MSVRLSNPALRAIVLDIEGTTTPVDFVYRVLFPFARAHIAEYLKQEWDSGACREAVALLKEEFERDSVGRDCGPAAITAYALQLMDLDKKSRGLKLLQGLIWEGGYRTGQLKGDVYPDVPPALERWHARGCRIYIYSSGSVLAQQLLFGSTAAGDLTHVLSGYFDTAVGPKRSVDSYRAIAASVEEAPAAMLFVSDVVEELDAARAAGLHTALAVRPGASAASGNHPVIHSFDEIHD